MRVVGWTLAMFLLLYCGNAFALSAGGKTKKHRNSNNKEGKDDKDQNEDDPPEKAAPAAKPALPAPENVIVLSTYVFDAVGGDLGLSDEQKTKIEAAKKDIREKGEALAKEQADARTSYEATKKPKEVEAALERVVTAASACKHFSPQTDFNQALSRILTADQFAKYVELVNKR